MTLEGYNSNINYSKIKEVNSIKSASGNTFSGVNSAAQHERNESLSRLLVQCQLGDKHAFAQLYQQVAGRLNGIAYRITGNVDSANDVLQEAFIQIWKNRNQYQADKSSAFTWLVAIVRYRAYDRLRYDKRRHQQDTVEFDENNVFEFQLDEITYFTQQLEVSTHTNQALTFCLSQLEQKQSQSILMAYIYGYSRKDISRYLDTPINTIKSWIRRGLGRLQLCLSS